MTPRNISKAGGRLLFPFIDGNAGLINDPVMIKLSNDKFWLSIADGDVLFMQPDWLWGAGSTQR